MQDIFFTDLINAYSKFKEDHIWSKESLLLKQFLPWNIIFIIWSLRVLRGVVTRFPLTRQEVCVYLKYVYFWRDYIYSCYGNKRTIVYYICYFINCLLKLTKKINWIDIWCISKNIPSVSYSAWRVTLSPI